MKAEDLNMSSCAAFVSSCNVLHFVLYDDSDDGADDNEVEENEIG